MEEPVYDNPYDPLNEDYLSPKATLYGSITPDSVLTSTSLIFNWIFVNPSSTFSYMLRGYENTWSAWSAINTTAFNYLDDGTYTFLVKERYNEEIVQELPDSVRFTIDAVKDCALILRKWAVNAITGTTFTIYLDLENVTGFKGLTTYIDFPYVYCTLQSVEKIDGSIEGTDGLIFIATPVEDANTTGRVEINAVCLGSAEGFSGNGTICKLEFESNFDGQYSININETGSVLRDSVNNTIDISMVRGTIVN